MESVTDTANPTMFPLKRVLSHNYLRSGMACALVVSGLLTLPLRRRSIGSATACSDARKASSGNQILVRSAYTLSYDEGRKSAVWAAYEVTPGSIGIASSLSRDLIRDDWVSESLTAADLAALAEQEYVRSQHVPWSALRELLTGVKSTLPRTPRCAAEV